MGKIKLSGYVCERCGHKWVARNKQTPRVCPKCKSPYWNIARKKRGKK
jgi:rubrerythrin